MTEYRIEADKNLSTYGGEVIKLLKKGIELGSVSLHFNKSDLKIKAFVIHQQYRGKGHSSAFIEKIIDYGREKRYSTISLIACSDICDKTFQKGLTQSELVAFYQRHGFKKVDNYNLMTLYLDNNLA